MQAKAVADAVAKKSEPKSNPFAVRILPHAFLLRFLGTTDPDAFCQLSGNSAPNPFGLGSQIFGSPESENEPEAEQSSSKTEPSGADDLSDGSGSESEGSEDEEDALAAAVQATSLEDSPWTAAPAYAPLYLSTVSEYLPPPPKVKVPTGAAVDMDGDKGAKDKDGGSWALEGYENSIDVDHAFERFSKRVSYEGEQCLRCAACCFSHSRASPQRRT